MCVAVANECFTDIQLCVTQQPDIRRRQILCWTPISQQLSPYKRHSFMKDVTYHSRRTRCQLKQTEQPQIKSDGVPETLQDLCSLEN